MTVSKQNYKQHQIGNTDKSYLVQTNPLSFSVYAGCGQTIKIYKQTN